MPRPALVLASTSRYRRELLERLQLPFRCEAPAVDETPLALEFPEAAARRLAALKARNVAARVPGAVVIGSDQVAVRATTMLGKPSTPERCREQLRAASGREVEFLTAVHVIDGPRGREESHVDHTLVRFRELDETAIHRYVELDAPLDCAGGFKVESLGIALMQSVESKDPTALMGLPLIWLAGALARAGLSPL